MVAPEKTRITLAVPRPVATTTSALPSRFTSAAATATPPVNDGENGVSVSSSVLVAPLKTTTCAFAPGPVPAITSALPSPFRSPAATETPPLNAEPNGRQRLEQLVGLRVVDLHLGRRAGARPDDEVGAAVAVHVAERDRDTGLERRSSTSRACPPDLPFSTFTDGALAGGDVGDTVVVHVAERERDRRPCRPSRTERATRRSAWLAASKILIRPAAPTTMRARLDDRRRRAASAAAATPGGVQGCDAPWQAPPVEATQSCTIAAEAFGVWSR